MRRFAREASDVGPLPLAAMLAGALLLATIGASLRLVERMAASVALRGDARRAALGAPVPPSPRLERRPGSALAAVRAREDARLSSWGWADRGAGLARVPIERAIDALAEEPRR